MLVSPLLGPIMGIGFGLATIESNLIKRSLVTMAAGMAVAILVAMLIVWLSPIRDVTPELRARTPPTLARQSVVEGKSVSVRVALGGRLVSKTKKKKKQAK